MPKVYRVMKMADDKPEVGSRSCMLGVRETDIERDEGEAADGPVGPGKGGLSVNGCWRTINFNFLPARLLRGAKGKNSHHVWSLGEGPFVDSPFTPDLNLHLEGAPGHGVLEAARLMTLEDYQNSLAATRDDWQIDEQHANDCPICRQLGLPPLSQTAS